MTERNWSLRLLLLTMLVVPLGLGLTACAGGDNPHADWVLMPESSEKEMGKNASERLEEQIGLYESDTLAQYVDNVGSRIAVYSERPNLEYNFRILDIFMINALALPGGYIYVTRGLLDEITSEAQLAGILAHEIAHVAAYHAIKRQQWSILSMLSAAAVATQTGGRGLGESLMAQQMAMRGYTRSSEDQADRLGMRYAAQAGYDPKGLIKFLQRLNEIHGEIPDRQIVMMRTHPFLTDRVESARADLEYYRSLAPDTTITNRIRFNRYRRSYLYKPDEERFLEQFEHFVTAYENEDLETIDTMLAEDFQVGPDGASDTSTRSEFLNELNQRFRSSIKIEYEHRLLNLDVGDTQTTVQYEFKDTRHQSGNAVPTINQGAQTIDWRKEDESWRMKTLR